MKKKITLTKETSLPLDEAFQKFINEKKAENKSKYTLTYYESRWSYFYNFLCSKNVTETKEINHDLVIQYITNIKERNKQISEITINNYLRAVRCIVYYFIERGYTDNFKIKLINTKNTLKEPYTTEELKKLTKKPDVKKCSFSEYRNWVIVCHFLATGNRTRTLINIKIKHVNLIDRTIILDEVKNKLVYVIPISEDYFPIIKEYMSIRKGTSEDYLFCSEYGTKLTSDGLRTVMERYNKSRNVKRTGLHLFRHAFAKAWILKDGSSKKLQRALGHKTSSMVDNYVNIFGKELEEDFQKCTLLNDFKEEIAKEKIKMK